MITQLRKEDLPKDVQKHLKKQEKKERQPVGLKWLTKPFAKFLKLGKYASDKEEDVKVRVLVVRKKTGRFSGVDFHGAAIDIEYDSRKDLLTVRVHNTGTLGNHSNFHMHGMLQVPELMGGEDYMTEVHYPVADCREKDRKEWVKKMDKGGPVFDEEEEDERGTD